MALSKNTKSKLVNSFALAGSVPLLVGAGTMLMGGLSAAFNSFAAAATAPEYAAIGGGAILGAAAAVIGAYKAFDNGWFGKADLAAAVLFTLVGCPVIGAAGGFFAPHRSAKLAPYQPDR